MKGGLEKCLKNGSLDMKGGLEKCLKKMGVTI